MDGEDNYGSPYGCNRCCLKSAKKIEELRKLLTQSEEINDILQQDNELLQKTCADFKLREKKWLERKQQLREREQSLNDYCSVLSEQKGKTDQEIMELTQLLSQSKVENEKVLLKNAQLHEALVKRTACENQALKSHSESEKVLNEANRQLVDVKLELHYLSVALRDAEESRELYMKYVEELKSELSEKEKLYSEYKRSSLNHMKIKEEMLNTSDIDAMLCNTAASTDARERTLKNELDDCMGICPLQQDNVHQTINTSTQMTECLCLKCSILCAEVGSQIDFEEDCIKVPSYFCSSVSMQLVYANDASTQTDLEDSEIDFQEPLSGTGVSTNERYQRRKVASWKKLTEISYIILSIFFVIFLTYIFKDLEMNDNLCKASEFLSFSNIFDAHYIYPKGPPPV